MKLKLFSPPAEKAIYFIAILKNVHWTFLSYAWQPTGPATGSSLRMHGNKKPPEDVRHFCHPPSDSFPVSCMEDTLITSPPALSGKSSP